MKENNDFNILYSISRKIYLPWQTIRKQEFQNNFYKLYEILPFIPLPGGGNNLTGNVCRLVYIKINNIAYCEMINIFKFY